MKEYKLQLTKEVFVLYGGLARAGLLVHKTALPLRAGTLKMPATKMKFSNANVLSAYIKFLPAAHCDNGWNSCQRMRRSVPW